MAYRNDSKDENILRKTKVTVRFTKDEFEKLAAIKAETGLNYSEVIRKILMCDQIKVLHIDLTSTNTELRKIGNNVNQIARHFNEGFFDDYRQEDGKMIHSAFEKMYEAFCELRKDVSRFRSK